MLEYGRVTFDLRVRPHNKGSFTQMRVWVTLVSVWCGLSVSAASVRWGIAGLGRIAHDFTSTLKIQEASVVACAAGSLPNTAERSQAFARLFSIERAYSSYEDLAKDPDVDIVYIAVTNQLHYPVAKLFLEAGKNVLLEKPSVLAASDLEELIIIAESKHVFFSTNFWTRFFPAIKYARQVAESGEIGEIININADIGFIAPQNLQDRFLNRTLGGGSTLDIGIYIIQMATMFIEQRAPDSFFAYGNLNSQGVDIEASVIMKWNTAAEHSRIATLTYGLDRPSRFETEIYGSHGRITIHNPTNCPDAVTVRKFPPGAKKPVGPDEVIEFSHPSPDYDDRFGPENYPKSRGFVHVIQAVQKAIAENKIELAEITHKEQVEIAHLAEKVLGSIGVNFSTEQ